MNHHGESYWDRMLRLAFADEKAKRDAEREAAATRAITAECPCCNGAGRVGIVFGAKDDQ